MTATEPAAHFGFFTLEVLRTRRLGHSFLRVTFGGESLAGFRSGASTRASRSSCRPSTASTPNSPPPPRTPGSPNGGGCRSRSGP